MAERPPRSSSRREYPPDKLTWVEASHLVRDCAYRYQLRQRLEVAITSAKDAERDAKEALRLAKKSSRFSKDEIFIPKSDWYLKRLAAEQKRLESLLSVVADLEKGKVPEKRSFERVVGELIWGRRDLREVDNIFVPEPLLEKDAAAAAGATGKDFLKSELEGMLERLRAGAYFNDPAAFLQDPTAPVAPVAFSEAPVPAKKGARERGLKQHPRVIDLDGPGEYAGDVPALEEDEAMPEEEAPPREERAVVPLPFRRDRAVTSDNLELFFASSPLSPEDALAGANATLDSFYENKATSTQLQHALIDYLRSENPPRTWEEKARIVMRANEMIENALVRREARGLALAEERRVPVAHRIASTPRLVQAGLAALAMLGLVHTAKVAVEGERESVPRPVAARVVPDLAPTPLDELLVTTPEADEGTPAPVEVPEGALNDPTGIESSRLTGEQYAELMRRHNASSARSVPPSAPGSGASGAGGGAR